MKHEDRRIDRVFSGVRPPHAPPELRAQVLVAVRLASRSGQREDMWSRAWSSRPLRLAWAAVTALLIAGHLWLFSEPVRVEPGVSLTLAEGRRDLESELSEIVDLPRIDEEHSVKLP
jgi:hypothetical protein